MTLIQGFGRSERLLRVAACAGLVAVLAACGSSPRAPVENRSTGGVSVPRVDPSTLPGYEFRNKPGYYQVQPGETIRSIARNNSLDWRDIVRWNTQWVSNPDQIEVGQVLRISPPAGEVARTVVPSAPAAPRVTAPAASTATTAPSTPPASDAGTSSIALAWPTQSHTIVTPFDDMKNKGIGIGGKEGDPVTAAADGSVMYAGSGLRGYGNLVILKHNSTFLTVYAHNSKLLVKENQHVKKGQTIAEMGKTDADRVKLHFEVRRNGKTVNPLSYLPR